MCYKHTMYIIGDCEKVSLTTELTDTMYLHGIREVAIVEYKDRFTASAQINKNIINKLEQLYDDLADTINDNLVSINPSEHHNNTWVVTITKPNPLLKYDFMRFRTNTQDNAYNLFKQQIGVILTGISERIDLLTEEE